MIFCWMISFFSFRFWTLGPAVLPSQIHLQICRPDTRTRNVLYVSAITAKHAKYAKHTHLYLGKVGTYLRYLGIYPRNIPEIYYRTL